MMRHMSIIFALAIPVLVLAGNLPTTSDYPIADPLSRYTYTPADPFAIVWTAKADNTLDAVSRTTGFWGTDGKYHLICGNCNTHTSHPNERVFDPVANSWADGLTRPGAGLHNHGGAAIGSKIYVGGGSSGAGYDNNFTVIDLVANTWTTINAMPIASLLYYEMVAGSNGRIYFFGGAASGTTMSNQTWEFNPGTTTWTQRANMPTALRDPAGACVGDTIYLAGGSNSSGYTPVNTFTKYCISGNSFSTGVVLPQAFLWGAAMVATHRDSGAQVIVLGGQLAAAYLNTAYRYNVRGGYWVTETPMNLTRRSHAGDARASRWLFAAGGWNGTIMGQCEEGTPSFVGVEAQSEPSIRDNIRLSTSPNPFTNRVVISYTLPRSQTVEVSIFDVSGKLVQKLAAGLQAAGTHRLTYDNRSLNAGVYIVRLTTDSFTRTTKLILAQ